MTNPGNIWALVPAAGIGQRMNSTLPKQYLELHGQPVLQHSLQRLLDIPRVAALVVAIREDDTHWAQIKLNTDKPVSVIQGGEERCHSVWNALQSLQKQDNFNAEHDWVLVHDAVRPCVRRADIERLIAAVARHPAGGLLALPVRDTIKRQHDNATVAQTIERAGLWQAQTPQLFPFQLLNQALLAALEKKYLLTDESSAMEAAGYAPLLIAGSADNIKITRPEDIRLAELYLDAQQQAL